MDWQQSAALGIVVSTAAVMGWAKVRARKARLGGAGHCGGCLSHSAGGSQTSIVFHARKGERPRIIYRPR